MTWTIEKCSHSIFFQKKMREYVDKDLLDGFIEDHTGEDQEKIIQYRKKWSAVLDAVRTGFRLPTHKWGRITPMNHLSLCVFPRPLRHSLCEKYIDLDMVNCHPCILYNYCCKNDLFKPYLRDYVEDPAGIRESIMKFYSISKQDAKKIMLRLLFGGSYKNWLIEYGFPTMEFLERFENEMKDIQEFIWLGNQAIYKSTSYSTIQDAKRGVMALWCQTIERTIQETCISSLGLCVENVIPCQDGFMILKTAFYDSICEDMRKITKDELDLDVKWVVKPFDEAFPIRRVNKEAEKEDAKCLKEDAKEEAKIVKELEKEEQKRLKELEKEAKKRLKEAEKEEERLLKEAEKEEEKRMKDEAKDEEKRLKEAEKEEEKRLKEAEKEEERLLKEAEKERLYQLRIQEKEDRERAREMLKREQQRAKERAREESIGLKIEEDEALNRENDQLFEKETAKFEKTHAKIKQSGVYVFYDEKNNTTFVYSEAQLRACYKHIQVGYTRSGLPINFIDRWLTNHNGIRIYNGMDVYPKNCPEDIYNMWNPFAMELITEWEEKPSAVELFKKHISILCNHEKLIVDYFLDWLGFLVQFPEIKCCLITLVSSEGAGKGLLFSLLKNLLGQKKVFETTDPARDVWGSFNSLMAECYLVNLNEISASDLKNAEGRIKGLITDSTMTINTKGVSVYTIKSHHKFIVTTNKSEAIKPSKNDRRTCLIECSDELCKPNKTEEELCVINDYIGEFVEMMNDTDSCKSIYEYLMGLNVDGFHTRLPPKTAFHLEQTTLTMSPIELWLREWIQLKEGVLTYATNELFKSFSLWRDTNFTEYKLTNVQFGVRLSRLNLKGITTVKEGGMSRKVFDISLLKPSLG